MRKISAFLFSLFLATSCFAQPTFNSSSSPLEIASGSTVFFPYQIKLPDNSYVDNGATGSILFVSSTGSGFVPYTGATANVDLGSRNLGTLGVINALTLVGYTVDNTSQTSLELQRNQPAGLYNTHWINYIPNSTTNWVLYNGANRLAISDTGNLELYGGNLTATGSIIATVSASSPILRTDKFSLPTVTGSTGQVVTLQTNGTSLWQTPSAGSLSAETDPIWSGVKTNYVPYSGATGSILTTYDISANGLFASGSVVAANSFLPDTNGGATLGTNGFGFSSLWFKDSASAFELALQVTNTGMAGDQTLTFDVGNYSPTVTFSPGAGYPTLGNWFNQNVKTTGSPSFANATANVLSVNAIGGAYYLPYSNGSTGQVITLQTNGTSLWQTSTGGSGTPGGSNTQVQFNNSSAFGGSSNLTWISSNTFSATGNTVIAASGNIVALKVKRGTDTSPTANLIEVYKNDGTTLLSSMAFDGRWRLAIPSSTPTITGGAGAGATPTLGITGTDSAGEITLTTGAVPSAASNIVELTFSRAFQNAPAIVFTPSNNNSALLSGVTSVYATSSTTTLDLASGTTGITGATQYKWMYNALGQ